MVWEEVKIMAIFGFSDKDMPYLSRVAQIDTNSEYELTHLIIHSQNVILQSEESESMVSGMQEILQNSNDIRIMREVCVLGQRLMESLADAVVTNTLHPNPNDIDRAALDELFDMRLWQYQEEAKAIVAMKQTINTSAPYLPQLRAPEGFVTSAPFLVLDYLWSLFYPVPGIMLRCKECNSPFLPYRKDKEQGFCSNRCTNRAGERRRRREQKNNEVALT